MHLDFKFIILQCSIGKSFPLQVAQLSREGKAKADCVTGRIALQRQARIRPLA